MSIPFILIAIAAGLVTIQVFLFIVDRIMCLIFFVICIKTIGIKKAIQIGKSEETERLGIKKAMKAGNGEEVENLGMKRGNQIREIENIMLNYSRLMRLGSFISKATYWPVTIKDYFSR